MRPEVARDLGTSAAVFAKVVWPAVAPLIGGGDYVSVETDASLTMGLVHDLDWIAGIDGFQVVRPDRMRGIASRVQFTDSPFDTFTVRCKRSSGAETELAKQLRAIDRPRNGWLQSAFTIQAYVTPGRHRLLGAGVVPTRALYDYARSWLEADDPNHLYVELNRFDGNEFLVIPWTGLVSDGVPLRRWPEDA